MWIGLNCVTVRRLRMALTKQKLLQLRDQQRAPALLAPAEQRQRMESLVAPKRMGRRQSVIERLQTRSVPLGAESSGVAAGGAPGVNEVGSSPASTCRLCGPNSVCGPGCVGRTMPTSTCQLCGPNSLCGPGCVGRTMPSGAVTPAPVGSSAAPSRRTGRRQSVIERLQAAPGEPSGSNDGDSSALSGVNAVVASLPMSVCQLCGPGSLCGPGCVGRSAPAGAIPSSGGAPGPVAGVRRAARRGSVVDRLSLRPDCCSEDSRLQSFASKQRQRTVNLAIGGGGGEGVINPETVDDGDAFDSPVTRLSSQAASPVRLGRRASIVVDIDGAKTILPTGPSRRKTESFGVPSFGKVVAVNQARGSSTVESTCTTATARPEVGAATTRDEVEKAFASALATRVQEYEKGCAQALDFKLKYFAKNLEKRLNRHSGYVAEVAAAISAVVADEAPRALDELATVASKQGGASRARALSSQLIAAALDQTTEMWRIRRRAAVRVNETDPELLAELFNKIDTDGSGLLDRDEIAQLSRDLGKPLSEAELDDAMLSMDADGSGEVDLEEFIAWFEAMKAAGKMPSWAAALAELQAKLRIEKEKEIRAKMLADQTANVVVVQHREAELAAARAKRQEDEAIQSEAEAASEEERIKKMAAHAEDSAELAVLRNQMLATRRELAELDHSISDQRSQLRASEARLSELRANELEKGREAAEGFKTGSRRAKLGTGATGILMRRRGANTRPSAVMLSSDDREGYDEPSVAAQLRAEMEADDEEDDYVEENDATKEKLDNIQTRLQVTNITHVCQHAVCQPSLHCHSLCICSGVLLSCVSSRSLLVF